MGTEIMAQTEKPKFLGVTLDENLSFRAHTNEISCKLSRSFGISYQLNSFLLEAILKYLCYSLVHSYINYNIESWVGASEYMLIRNRIL